jgi:hypothetical protein
MLMLTERDIIACGPRQGAAWTRPRLLKYSHRNIRLASRFHVQ